MYFLNNLFDTLEEDIFSGWAGSLISFQLIAPLIPERIKNKQIKEIQGWIDAEIPKRGFNNNLPGLAHGLSGIALGLRLFSKIDNWETGLKIAKFLENTIDSSFLEDLGGWESSLEIKMALESWCNGSAGIVLARKLSGGRFKKTVNLEIISKRLEERIVNCSINEYPLCHGTFGFAAAHKVISKKELEFDFPRDKHEFQQGLISGDEGIAYSLLSRSYHCPSVLAGIKMN